MYMSARGTAHKNGAPKTGATNGGY
jgi:hypothetical protein